MAGRDGIRTHRTGSPGAAAIAAGCAAALLVTAVAAVIPLGRQTVGGC
ncbi:hypothetical protein [Paractinoplanes rishiriensis]|nr:hypothetical protein [Actinoplanes rishiriensis]